MKVAVLLDRTHNPFDEIYRVSCLRENLTSSSKGEGLETGLRSTLNGHAGGNPGDSQGYSYELPRQSFTRQTAFFHLAEGLNCEINTLGYPRAALFGFGIGLVADNTLAVLKAALRVEHGSAVVDDELSGYYMTDEISAPYRGMMIAIPDEAWLIFRKLDVPTFSAWLLAMASKVRLEPLRKHRRGPKKPRTPRLYDPKRPHFATAKVLARKNE